MGKKDPAESLEKNFRVKKNEILSCESGIRNFFDPGSGIWDEKNSDLGLTSRIRNTAFSKTGPNLAHPPYSMSKNQRTVKFLDGPRSCVEDERTNLRKR